MANVNIKNQEFCLKWQEFEDSLTSGLQDLLQNETMVDVTLAVDGHLIHGHKIILSVCSSYFRKMFEFYPCKHPIIILHDVKYQTLSNIMDFMYRGEAYVKEEELGAFLKLGQTLKVRGLNPDASGEASKKGPVIEMEEVSSRKRKKHSKSTSESGDSQFSESENVLISDKKRKTTVLNTTEDYTVIPIVKLKKENDIVVPPSEEIEFKVPIGDTVEEQLEYLDHVEEDTSANQPNEEIQAQPGPLDSFSDLPSVFQSDNQSSRRSRVPIWDFFDVNHDLETATCKTCKQTFTNKRKWGTVCVKRHLVKHPEIMRLEQTLKSKWLEEKTKNYSGWHFFAD